MECIKFEQHIDKNKFIDDGPVAEKIIKFGKTQIWHKRSENEVKRK